MRLAIVDDDGLTRELLVLLLGDEATVEAYASAEEALERLGGFNPEVLLVDLGLPDMDGSELIRRVKQAWPGTEVVINTISEDRSEVIKAIKAGASSYILKGSSTQAMQEALSTIYMGGASMSSRIAHMLMLELQNDMQAGYLPLNDHESVILQGIANGLSNRELAKGFNISPHAVHIHIKNIYMKFHAQVRSNDH